MLEVFLNTLSAMQTRCFIMTKLILDLFLVELEGVFRSAMLTRCFIMTKLILHLFLVELEGVSP